MKEIKLTQGLTTQVDDEDYEYLNQFKWYAHKGKYTYYAERMSKTINGNRKQIRMHRLIINTLKGILTDHRDRNGLNNQKDNIRNCNNSQNGANRKASGISQYLGVSYNKSLEKFVASIQINKKITYLGCFKTDIEAAKVYDEAARKYHGEFANLNFK